MALFFKIIAYLVATWFAFLVFSTYFLPVLKSLLGAIAKIHLPNFKSVKKKSLLAPLPKQGNIWTETKPLQEKLFIRNENPAHFISNFLKEKQLFFKTLNQGECFSIPFDLENRGSGEFIVAIENEYGLIKFQAVLYRNLPDNAMYKISELSTRFNERLSYSKFNVLHDERILVYEMTHFLKLTELTNDILEFYVRNCIYALENYKPLVARVIEQGEEPILVVIEHFMNFEGSRSHSQSDTK